MIKEALRLHNLGLKIIPTALDKRPLCKWKKYQDSQTIEDVQLHYSQEKG
jgi:hypothetical protein